MGDQEVRSVYSGYSSQDDSDNEQLKSTSADLKSLLEAEEELHAIW